MFSFFFQLCGFGGKEENQGYKTMLDAFSKDGVFCLEAVTRSTAVCSKEEIKIQPFFPFYSNFIIIISYGREISKELCWQC